MVFTFWKQPGGKTVKCSGKHFTEEQCDTIFEFLIRMGFKVEIFPHKTVFTREG